MEDDSQLRVTPFATHWGTYHAEVRGGKVVGVRDYADDPDPAVIGPGIVDMVEHPTRVGRPMIRKGFLEKGKDSDRSGRGREPFVAVPWDEALEIASGELDRVRKAHGNQAIFGGSYGWGSAGRFHHAQSQVHRFLNCIGGYTPSIDTYSYAAVSAISPHVVGHFARLVLNQATAWPHIVENCELMVMFGGMAIKNAQVTSGGVGRHTTREALLAAKRNGTQFVSVSPLRSDAIDLLDADWVAARPNSDTALMLALAHTIHSEGLHDQAFLDRYCTGFDRFLPYLTGQSDGQPKDADWAAGICALEAEMIRSLARRMAGKRTMITVSWSMQRADHGEQPGWMAIVLAAMLGQIGLPGGGFGIGYGSENGIGNPVLPFKFPAVPQGQNPIAEGIPVARISDALLHPGEPYDFNGRRTTYPDLRLVYWVGGNPFHHHQDINKLVSAFQRPETIIVNEIWWTPMARHADIVLPVTTVLEREDIAMTHWEPLIVAMRQAVEPVGDARHDYDIFSGLAHKLGVGETFTEGRSPEDWLRHLWDQARQRAAEANFELPSLEELRAREMITLPDPDRHPVLLESFRNDPEGNPLETPSGKIEIFSERIAGFDYDDCPGHPAWMEPYEWLGGPDAEHYPLHLVSNQPRTRLHSQFDPGSVSRASKIQGREPMTMNPIDAAARGLSEGDVVRVFNDRGACLAGIILSDTVMPGVVQLSTGAWYDPLEPGVVGSLCKHGNPNVLTRDKGTSRLGQGPSAHSTLVEVEKFEGPLPPITAFAPPPIKERD
ncbi:molybdopterin guanine dinucleotide-containing S/N-oxide reductase [Limibacillus halophilus]|uniref:Biotin/methionine sulfoxide reductase n=1 Tax=Limibacillus halophilus TaxID=1579333 RepID=A0A839SQX7_9PROT|nr:molybdopterin guanine dinucleotide-containing S/N-oxide reductase [Limibacillus halophilus]MBB3064892.1 biotin/methionine sulfoxide reductase [Limibacillus halophilus]